MDIELIVLGDICPDKSYTDWFEHGTPENVFNDILPLLKASDYVVANLEAPVISKGNKINKTSMNLSASPNTVKILAESDINALSLANNHILDYGVEGLSETISNLIQNNIEYYGVGSSNNVLPPHLVNKNGIKVGFLSFAEREFNCCIDYGIGAFLWNDIDGLKIIYDAKKKCDYLVVQYHGGIENYIYPSPMLQNRCRAMAEAGADLVVCQHSHIIGTKEKWNKADILYGQGNTIFGYSKDEGDYWNQGLICRIIINKTENQIKSSIDYIPIIAKEDGEFLADNELKTQVLQKLDNNSLKIKDSEFINEQWRSFCKRQSSTYLPLLLGWNKFAVRINKILKGSLVNLFIDKNKKRNIMNLIRCDAHREVIQTILEEDFYRS